MRIEVPILNSEYKTVVVWNEPWEKVEKMWQKHFDYKDREDRIKDDSENHRGTHYAADDTHPFIVVWVKHTSKDFYGTLAHEAVHAVEHICQRIGQPFGGEFAAHSVGAIVRAVTKKIKGK